MLTKSVITDWSLSLVGRDSFLKMTVPKETTTSSSVFILKQAVM